jgi:hypothetical protein
LHQSCMIWGLAAPIAAAYSSTWDTLPQRRALI